MSLACLFPQYVCFCKLIWQYVTRKSYPAWCQVWHKPNYLIISQIVVYFSSSIELFRFFFCVIPCWECWMEISSHAYFQKATIDAFHNRMKWPPAWIIRSHKLSFHIFGKLFCSTLSSWHEWNVVMIFIVPFNADSLVFSMGKLVFFLTWLTQSCNSNVIVIP